jgi:hypothetical protein
MFRLTKHTPKAGWLVLLPMIALLLAATAGLAEEKVVGTKLLDKKTTIKIQGIGESDSDTSYKFKIGDKEVQIDAKDAKVGDIYIGKADTINDDVVTKGGSITVDGMVNGDCVAFGGGVTVNGTVMGDVATFGGASVVAGRIKGDVATFGGAASIDGTVSGDVAAFGGMVKLGPASSVGGDIATIGGTVDRAEGARVGGQIKNLDLGMLNQFIPGVIGSATFASHPKPVAGRAIKFFITFFMLAGLGILITLLGVFFSKPIERITHIIEVDFWKSAGIGFLVQISLAPALVFMAVSILGIPLIPLAVLLVVAGILMSIASFGVIINQKFLHAVNKPPMNTLPAVVLGFVLLHSLFLLGTLINIAGSPLTALGVIFIIINFIVLWCGVTVGLGAVWTTRLGTRDQAPPRLPRAQKISSAE